MIETLAQLRALYAAPAERAQKKQQPQLDAHCQRFIALSPFCVLASAGAAQGALLDASPRGGVPGFARTPDAHTVLDRKSVVLGNSVYIGGGRII